MQTVITPPIALDAILKMAISKMHRLRWSPDPLRRETELIARLRAQLPGTACPALGITGYRSWVEQKRCSDSAPGADGV